MSEIITPTTERESLGDGRYRDTVNIKPIAYSAGGGNYRRITNKLGSTGDDGLPLGSDELLSFAINPYIAGRSPVIRLGCGSSLVTLALIGARNGPGTAMLYHSLGVLYCFLCGQTIGAANGR